MKRGVGGEWDALCNLGCEGVVQVVYLVCPSVEGGVPAASLGGGDTTAAYLQHLRYLVDTTLDCTAIHINSKIIIV